MRVVDDAAQRIADHAAIDDDTDPVAGAEDGVEIVRDHHYRQLQLALQVNQQLIEGRGADRVETGRRLVEEQQQRIQRQRARQRRALDHATRQLRRVLQGGIERQPDQPHLEQCQLIERARRQLEVLDHRQLYVLLHVERAEQRALLEGHAVAGLELDKAPLRSAAAARAPGNGHCRRSGGAARGWSAAAPTCRNPSRR